MAERLGVLAVQLLAAAAAGVGVEGDDFGALLGGDQGPVVSFMSGLSARLLFGVGLGLRRPGVGVLAAGRQGGVLGSLEALFELGDARQE
jgi:hypothetical protein